MPKPLNSTPLLSLPGHLVFLGAWGAVCHWLSKEELNTDLTEQTSITDHISYF